jgi:head-tail adaptor
MPAMPSVANANKTGAGELRQRITFAERNTIEDEFGNVSTGWVTRFTVSADLWPRLGGETIEAARLAGRQPVIIRVRRSPDTKQIKTDWKATDADGNEYNIRTVADGFSGDAGHGMYLDMMAESGVAV